MIHEITDKELQIRKPQRKKKTHLRESKIIQTLYNRAIELRTSEGCKLCGTLERLVFHHKRPEDKLFSISAFTTRMTFQALERELAKCIVLCNSCHALVHRVPELLERIQLEEVSYEVMDFEDDPNKLARIISKWGLKISTG